MNPMIDGDPVEPEKIKAMNSAFREATELLRDVRFRSTHMISNIVESIRAAKLERVIVGYRHPVHEFKNWTVVTTIEEAVQFLGDRIDSERGDGLDLKIASEDLSHLWSTTHDGDAYQFQ